MNYQRTTQVPNVVFDSMLPLLTYAELKVLLVIIRQTYGWVNKHTGKRKAFDRITHAQFIKKTALSRRSVSNAIASLSKKGLIKIVSSSGDNFSEAKARQGNPIILYSLVRFLE